ncbi:hypothetical protein ACLK1T_17555 [Escherichia coli]
MKKWLNGKETLETLDNLALQSAFTGMDLKSYQCRAIACLPSA